MRKIPGTEFDSLVTFFDQMAQTPWLSGIHDKIIEETGSWDNRAVLDIGCGSGRLLMRGQGKAKCRIGIDLSEEMIKKAKTSKPLAPEGNSCRFLVGDAYDLPFVSEQFDLVISTCVLFLLPKPEVCLAEMARMLKKDHGLIAMLNPAMQMNAEAVEDYCQTFNIEDFAKQAMQQWAKVSTRRHRYNREQLEGLIEVHHFEKIRHFPVLDGLAYITIAERSSN